MEEAYKFWKLDVGGVEFVEINWAIVKPFIVLTFVMLNRFAFRLLIELAWKEDVVRSRNVETCC
jgi:hypothetical protein